MNGNTNSELDCTQTRSSLCRPLVSRLMYTTITNTCTMYMTYNCSADRTVSFFVTEYTYISTLYNFQVDVHVVKREDAILKRVLTASLAIHPQMHSPGGRGGGVGTLPLYM